MYISAHEAEMMMRERTKDALREAERERLIQIVGLRPTASAQLYRKAANWLGTRLMSWGQNLLRSDTIPAYSEQHALTP